LSVYGPVDATAIPKSHNLLPQFQTGFIFLVPAYPVVLEKKPFKRVSVVYCNHSSLFYYINTAARKTGPLIINRQTANKSTKHFRQDFGDAQRQDEASQATVLPVSFSALGLLGE